jgi:PKD repeat protein/glucose/arabinose dehydrogenase
MLGGYFHSHPPGTPTANVVNEDPNEPSTTGIPATWTRTDEWYNFRSPATVPGDLDYSPRKSGVHVLMTVDETTYAEDDGTAAADDHPIAWCTDFDGGRVWYTGMGHTQGSFAETDFRKHLLGGIQTAAGAAQADCGAAREEPSANDFEKVTIDDDTANPMEMDIAADGRVFYIERGNANNPGLLRIWDPTTEQTSTAGSIPVYTGEENGLIGLKLAPDFETSGWVYLAYSALPESTNQQRVSRFKLVGDTLDIASEQIILTWQHQRETCCHSSGSIAFGPDGALYVSIGDNTNPFESDGFAPIDERLGRAAFDAQRTSANTNDLNGKVLRVMPMANPTGPPGVNSTYTIPTGNLFDEAQDTQGRTRPEIYAMGFRNPFRMTVDQETGWVLLGDYGPDAGATVASRGPQGSVEWNVIKQAGNFGWPYCVRDNVPYKDYDFATGISGADFNCSAPVNNSPNNTGLTQLPPAQPAAIWEGYTEMDPRNPGIGRGGAPTGGPRYHFDPDGESLGRLPESYDGRWFIGEWNNNWLKTVGLDANGTPTDTRCFAICRGILRPMDIEIGPDGHLYVIEWGSGFGGNNTDSGVYRFDFIRSGRRPRASATATPDNGPAPLTVQFSSAGSVDPDGTAITYAWDFDGNGTTDSTDANATHVYTTPGNYTATLRVTDAAGQVGVDNVPITVGNTKPVVTIQIPENGQFASFGEEVPYRITVTDAEDGTIGPGSPDCSRITLNIKLGHDDHAHTLGNETGCEGTFNTASDGGHGGQANIFPIIEAVYTDKGGAGTSNALSDTDEVIFNTKRKQVEYFDSTGRVAGAPAGGDPGVQTETTTDAGGGLNIGFIEDGDYVSYAPVNLENLDKVAFRVASAGAGGTIELRRGAPDGALITQATVTPTGGWQSWQTVEAPLPPTEGTFELFVVFRGPAGGLMNLNWFEVHGRGAAITAAPDVTAAASPTAGEAPLEVQFDGQAVDPEGEALTYRWDFGVAGTTDDTSTELDPTYTYTRAGTYTATFTATDAAGGKASATVQVRVTAPPSQCPTGPVRSDEFEGDQLDTERWTVLRPDEANPFSVAGGRLALPIANGSMYGTGTTAKNLILQDLPDGEWQVTAKITAEQLTENYHQAGLRVYTDDNNWASVHMISAGGQRDIEFIYEANGNPRNEGTDKLGGIPADAPTTYYVRITSDGTNLNASYSYDGDQFLPVGRPAPISTFTDPKIGPAALSDAAPSVPTAYFDWIRFNPDGSTGGGGGGGTALVDEFNGTDLATPPWEVVRRNQDLSVSGGALRIPAAPGDIYGGRNDASNIVLRDAPDGAWQATAKVNFEGTAQYHQAGVIVYGDDGNFTKFGRIAHTATGDEKFEFIYENAGTPRNEAADSTGNIPADFPDDFYVRMTSDGTNLTGAYSTDGSTWTPVGRPAPLPANARVGMFAFSNDGTGNPQAAFDSFTLATGGGGGPVGPSRDDEFDGSSLDKTRWNAIVRDVPAEYSVAGGKLTITTGPGDIYSNDTNPLPDNFILQSADHAGADWVIETKIDGATINGGWAQGGLLAYSGGNDYVKFDAISDDGQTRINRLELRSETNGTPVGPASPADPPVAAGTTEIWLRLKKAGQSYTGEYSFDGVTWTGAGTVTNAMTAPAFGLYAFGPLPAGQGDTVPFEYFTLDGPDGPACDCESAGDEFDGAQLNKTTWNSIVREDDTKYTVQDGALRVTTVGGDIYSGPDSGADTRNFFLQTPDHAGADWVIETKVSGDLSGGYEQGGLLAYEDDGDYVKFDLISDDGTTAPNRIELRSEESDAVQDPQPQVTPLPAGTSAAWLRLTKTGTSYTGEYSFDGQTWTALPATVQNDMPAPRFGLFTLGVNSPGGTIVFDYFSVDGETGCEPGEENEAPVIGAATATPSSGFAPLPVDFTAEATDADEDQLTYSWDFDGDGAADANTKNASHTYAEAGEYEAKVTVSDGEDSVSRTVPVTVLPDDDPAARFRVLVFSKTAGFRHSSIDEGIAAIKKLGQDNGFQVDATEQASVFRDGVLSHFDTVVFLSTTGDVLNLSQQAAFERYIGDGGGYTGIHAASDTEYEWRWYGNLVGAYFRNHPANQTATVKVEDQEHPSTKGLPADYSRLDEWYNFKAPAFAEVGDADFSPRARVHVLATVDESTYSEEDGNTTDDDHPVTWCQRYDGGRSWYTAMGHTEESFVEANFLQQVLGGIETTAGAKPSASCGIPPDLVAPTSTATLDPASPAKGPVQVTLAATDDAGGTGVDKIEYKLDGAADWTAYSGPFTVSAEGRHTVTFRATDKAGNVESAKSVDVVVDLTAPTTSHTLNPAKPDKKSGVYKQPVQVTLSAADGSGSGVALTEYRINGGAWQPYPAPFTLVADGTHTVEYRSVDKAGNVEATKSVVVRIKKPGGFTPPA